MAPSAGGALAAGARLVGAGRRRRQAGSGVASARRCRERRRGLRRRRAGRGAAALLALPGAATTPRQPSCRASAGGRKYTTSGGRRRISGRHPEHPAERETGAVALDEHAGSLAKRRVEALADLLEPVAAGGGSSAQHGAGIDLERAADGLREGAGEGRVGQRVEAVGLEQLELLLRHLDRRRERGDVQALALARLAQQPRPRSARNRADRRARGLTHRTRPVRRPRPRASPGSGCAAGCRTRPRPGGCRACSRCARRATASARWRPRAAS